MCVWEVVWSAWPHNDAHIIGFLQAEMILFIIGMQENKY